MKPVGNLRGAERGVVLREILTSLLLVIGSVFFTVLLFEIVLRGYYVFQNEARGPLSEQIANASRNLPKVEVGTTSIGGLVQPSIYPDMVYELKPNLKGHFQGVPIEFNSFGMRDREYTQAKEPGTYRIVGLGDSVMFGWGVEVEKSYLKLLERMLNDALVAKDRGEIKKFEVLNFGVPGYNTTMEVSAFENKVLRFQPDLVIIHFVRNDIEVPLFMNKPKEPFATNRLYLLDLVRDGMVGLGGNSTIIGASLQGLDKRERSEVLEQYRHMLGQDGYRRAMAKLGKLTQERNIPVVLLRGSSSRRMKRVIKNLVVPRWGFHLLEIKPFMNRYAEEHGIGENQDKLRKAIQLSSHDSHPNTLGHLLYAQALFQKLTELGLVSIENHR